MHASGTTSPAPAQTGADAGESPAGEGLAQALEQMMLGVNLTETVPAELNINSSVCTGAANTQTADRTRNQLCMGCKGAARSRSQLGAHDRQIPVRPHTSLRAARGSSAHAATFTPHHACMRAGRHGEGNEALRTGGPERQLHARAVGHGDMHAQGCRERRTGRACHRRLRCPLRLHGGARWRGGGAAGAAAC
jgi:hypothetical protein